MAKSLQLSFLICGFLLAHAVDDNCIYQVCYCSDNDISCAGMELTSVPEISNTGQIGFDILDLDSNNITTIPAGRLPHNLKEISIMENPLTNIEDSAFDDSATTLETLTLSNAVFTKLPDAFLHLKSLISLSISTSNISDWNEDAMKNIGQTLQILNVPRNGFTIWPEWIQHLHNLTQLSISMNHISTIPDDALDNVVHSLTSVALANNNLTSVPKALSKLLALKVLYLQENRISDVSWLPKASKLVSLSLNLNKINDAEQLSNALQPYADSLTDLEIESNNLPEIPSLFFLSGVGSLDFSNNQISEPVSGSLPSSLHTLNFGYNVLPFIPRVVVNLQSVADLDVSNNVIQMIRDIDFPLWIEQVTLGYNLITEITDDSFPDNSEIKYLHLNNNPISIVSINAFKLLPNLYQLDMSYTQLTRLPLGLSDIESLNVIDFTGNSNLVCTCMEKSLQARILSMAPDNVSGNCGLTTINDFFANLIKDCP